MKLSEHPGEITDRSLFQNQHSGREQLRTSPRPISTGQLHTSRCFHIRPINPVVYWEPYPIKWVGVLISKQASRLDAFSGYPSRT